jgi:hypothetical protein
MQKTQNTRSAVVSEEGLRLRRRCLPENGKQEKSENA